MLSPPPADQVLLAIDTYLEAAYPSEVSRMVARRLEALRQLPPGELLASGEFERLADGSYALRLGNAHYPHMKMVIHDRPDGHGALFSVDTHDRHCCPEPSSPEYGLFCGLMADNEKVARSVEERWAARGVPTFKSYLQQDLARRRGEAPPASR